MASTKDKLKPEVATMAISMNHAATDMLQSALPTLTVEGVQCSEVINKILVQFLDGYPLTLAMQMAVAFGWHLKEKAELNQKRIKLA